MAAGSRPLLLGHRGARATRSIPENTLDSFDLCLQHGCDGFEFDVRGTVDGVPMVCHDKSFRGLSLARTSAQNLAGFRAQGFLPTLEEVLGRFSGMCFLDVEVKAPGFEPQVLDLLHRYPPGHGHVVTSFLPAVLLRLRELDSNVPLGLIWDQPSADWLSLPVEWALPEFSLLQPALASALRGVGKRIGAWTANDPPDMLRLASLGAEILISDDTACLVNTFPVS